MSNSLVKEMLKNEIDHLPENMAETVFDFVQFIKAQRAEEWFLWQQVEETRLYRSQHPDEVFTMSAEEWRAS